MADLIELPKNTFYADGTWTTRVANTSPNFPTTKNYTGVGFGFDDWIFDAGRWVEAPVLDFGGTFNPAPEPEPQLELLPPEPDVEPDWDGHPLQDPKIPMTRRATPWYQLSAAIAGGRTAYSVGMAAVRSPNLYIAAAGLAILAGEVLRTVLSKKDLYNELGALDFQADAIAAGLVSQKEDQWNAADKIVAEALRPAPSRVSTRTAFPTVVHQDSESRDFEAVITAPEGPDADYVISQKMPRGVVVIQPAGEIRVLDPPASLEFDSQYRPLLDMINRHSDVVSAGRPVTIETAAIRELVPDWVSSPRVLAGVKPDVLVPAPAITKVVTVPVSKPSWLVRNWSPAVTTAAWDFLGDYTAPDIPPTVIGLGVLAGVSNSMILHRTRSTSAVAEYAASSTLRSPLSEKKTSGGRAYLGALAAATMLWGGPSEVLDLLNVFQDSLVINAGPKGRIVIRAESIREPGTYYTVVITGSQYLSSLPVNARLEVLRAITDGRLSSANWSFRGDRFTAGLMAQQVSDMVYARLTQAERRAMNDLGIGRGPFEYGNVSTWYKRQQRLLGN